MLKRAIIAVIRFYQTFLSPLKGPSCRFTPTCSQYALDAVTKRGVLRGTWMSVKRISKCQPFHPGGHDPVVDE